MWAAEDRENCRLWLAVSVQCRVWVEVEVEVEVEVSVRFVFFPLLKELGKGARSCMLLDGNDACSLSLWSLFEMSLDFYAAGIRVKLDFGHFISFSLTRCRFWRNSQS